MAQGMMYAGSLGNPRTLGSAAKVWNPKLGSVKITSQAGLRAVNGTRAREDAKGPNKTLESAEVREIDMAEGVIIPGIIRKGLDWTLNSANVR